MEQQKKTGREKAAEVFDELFEVSKKRNTPPVGTVDPEETDDQFKEAVWDYAGRDGDEGRNFEELYQKHQGRSPMAKRLARSGMNKRYLEARGVYDQVKGDKAKLDEAKKKFSW